MRDVTAPALIITADDYGYSRVYDRGILEAAQAGAIDAVSAFAGPQREVDPGPLGTSGVEVGLHLELAPGADPATQLLRQLDAFESLYGRPPAYLDGHRHRHARRPFAVHVARIARERGLPVRSVDSRQRRTLRCLGVPTPDRLIGRGREGDAAMPREIGAIVRGDPAPSAVIEWMTHPGHRDPGSGSSYDAGREEDLRLLLGLREEPALLAIRRNHREALTED